MLKKHRLRHLVLSLHGKKMGKNRNSDRLYFLGLQNHYRWWLQPWNKRCLFLGRKTMTNLYSVLKSRDITLPTKVIIVKAMVFPVVMYGCESWTVKKVEHWRTDAFELCWRRLLRVLWTPKGNPKGNQSWICIGRTDAEAEPPVLWLPDVKSGLIRKDPNAGNYWGQEEKDETENKIAGWHHWTNGHEFEQTPGDGEGQWSLMRSQRVGHDLLSNWTTTAFAPGLCWIPLCPSPFDFPLYDWVTEQLNKCLHEYAYATTPIHEYECALSLEW